MKKILLFIACCIEIFSLIFLTGCRHTFPFMQEESQIASIEIVSLKYVSSDRCLVPEELLICEVDNISAFMADFSKMKVVTVAPPNRSNIFQTPNVIKIMYFDGAFEYIAPMGTRVYRPDGFQNFYGVNTFNHEQFADLIDKYIDEIPIELEYNFLLPETGVLSVEIVNVGEAEDAYSVSEEQTLVCEIEDVSDFLIKFSGIDCFLNKRTPTKVQDGSTVFKINYGDGYYELIGANGQSKFYGETYALDGYRYFNEKQFADLVESYIKQ